MDMRGWIGIVPAAAVCVLGQSALAGPTDDELRGQINEFSAWVSAGGPSDQAQFQERLTALVNAHAPADLTTSQIGMLGQYYVREGSKLIEAYNVVDARSVGDSPEAANAAVVAAWLWMWQQRVPPSAEELRELIGHPGLEAALQRGEGGEIFGILAMFATNAPPQVVRPMVPELIELTGAIERVEGYVSAVAASRFYQGVREHIEDRAVLDAFRDRVVGALDRAREGLDDSQGHIAQSLEDVAREMRFIGGEAPEMVFDWTSEGLTASSLEDLKGKVVVIDFWATWCRPCIAAFPKVRHLAERYEGLPVEIIGVTYIQGTHFAPDGSRIDTRGDVEKEYALMAEYRGQQDMSWHVAFADGQQYSRDYFVTAIPNVTIIAPDGTVRFAGLNPNLVSQAQEEAMIDGLLEEFGLPTPEG